MSVQKLETKAIIIGAGPAGAGTSIYLTQAGIPHVIIEKETFPRDKVCGDACSGKTAFVLRKANPGWLQEIFSNGLPVERADGAQVNYLSFNSFLRQFFCGTQGNFHHFVE